MQEIFEKSFFGVEIEGCVKFLSDIRKCNTRRESNNYIDKLICYANEYVNANCIPLIIDNTNKKPIEKLLFYNPISDLEKYGTGEGWCYIIDRTIKCNNTDGENLSAEIVSPILSMSHQNYFDPENHTKNNIWSNLEKNFGKQYFEGIFILVMWFIFIFNNKYCNIGRMFEPIDNSTGLHVHYSNKLLTKSTEGVYILRYILKYFIFFEDMILSFLHESRTNNEHIKKIIPERLKENHALIFWNNIISKLIGKSKNTFNKFHELIYCMTDAWKDRRHTLNLTINFLNEDNIKDGIEPINIDEPLRFEFRLHHGTTNIKEIYYWTNFICLFMSSCINKGLNHYYDDNIFDFNFIEIIGKSNYEQIIFDLMFDEFVPDNNIKKYYHQKLLQRNPHSPVIFTDINIIKRIDIICEKYFGGLEEDINIDSELEKELKNVEKCYLDNTKLLNRGYKKKYTKYCNKNKK
jgi:hypothetical protein